MTRRVGLQVPRAQGWSRASERERDASPRVPEGERGSERRPGLRTAVDFSVRQGKPEDKGLSVSNSVLTNRPPVTAEFRHHSLSSSQNQNRYSAEATRRPLPQ